jgi:hypothetical protein
MQPAALVFETPAMDAEGKLLYGGGTGMCTIVFNLFLFLSYFSSGSMNIVECNLLLLMNCIQIHDAMKALHHNYLKHCHIV